MGHVQNPLSQIREPLTNPELGVTVVVKNKEIKFKRCKKKQSKQIKCKKCQVNFDRGWILIVYTIWWNSTYFLLERLKKLKTGFRFYVANYKNDQDSIINI